MTIQSIIDSISSKANIDPQIAQHAAGTVLSVIQHEAPDIATQLFSKIPGAGDLASANDVLTPGQSTGSGLFGTISSLIGNVAGEKVGALVNGVAALKASGLTADQISQAGSQVIGYAREKDPQLVDQLVANVPALKGHFGL